MVQIRRILFAVKSRVVSFILIIYPVLSFNVTSLLTKASLLYSILLFVNSGTEYAFIIIKVKKQRRRKYATDY
jgi:hypothetical protein